MNIIKSIIIVSAIVASGSAFADQGSGSDTLSQAVSDSRAAFSAKSTVQRNDFTGNIPASVIRNATTQANTFPVNTSNLSQGGNR